jgi:hypothetical protein
MQLVNDIETYSLHMITLVDKCTKYDEQNLADLVLDTHTHTHTRTPPPPQTHARTHTHTQPSL